MVERSEKRSEILGNSELKFNRIGLSGRTCQEHRTLLFPSIVLTGLLAFRSFILSCLHSSWSLGILSSSLVSVFSVFADAIVDEESVLENKRVFVLELGVVDEFEEAIEELRLVATLLVFTDSLVSDFSIPIVEEAIEEVLELLAVEDEGFEVTTTMG